MTYCFHCASEGHDPINCWLAPTQPEQGYGQLAIRDMKPNYNISFHKNGQEIGKLDFNGPKLVFTGDAEESAKVFIDWIAGSFHGRLEEERKAEREACAKAAEDFLTSGRSPLGRSVADAIRARGNT